MFLTTAFRRLCSLQHHTRDVSITFLSSHALPSCPGLSLRIAFPLTSNLCFGGRLLSTPTVLEGSFMQVRPGGHLAVLPCSCVSRLPCAVGLSQTFGCSLPQGRAHLPPGEQMLDHPLLAFLARGTGVCSDKRGTREVRGSAPRHTDAPCWPEVYFVIGNLFGLGVTSGVPAGGKKSVCLPWRRRAV